MASESEDRFREVVRNAYWKILGREADPFGERCWVDFLISGNPEAEMENGLRSSEEFALKEESRCALEALHRARTEMVRHWLPQARVIVDLGGGCIGDERGALVSMGYPHRFERLYIVEPPEDERHEIYKDVPDVSRTVETWAGPVEYFYSSMADLKMFPDGSTDLVFSGETIEHVSVADCRRTLAEVSRILRKDGFFCFDTPNRAITEIQNPGGFINPDHKIEYRHEEMLVLLDGAGLTPVEIKGICHMPVTRLSGVFSYEEMCSNAGVYEDYDNCYLIYYRCVSRS